MRRRVAGAGLALALAACGGEGSPVVEGALSRGGTTTSTVAGAPATDPGAGSSPAGAAASPTTAPPAGGGAPGGGGPGAAPPSPGVASFPPLDGNVAPGAFAPAVLRPDRSERVVVEVQAVPGSAPARVTLDHLRSTLASITGKEVVLAGGGTPPGSTRWTSATIRAAADAGARAAQGAGTAVLRILFLPGTFESDDDVLGVAVRGDVAAVFVEQAAAAGASLLGDSSAVEVAVATHEVGHLLGLVDLHLATGRADPAHPGHSVNRESVMYYAVESGSALGVVFGPNPPNRFDADDMADLAAIAAGG